MKPIKFTTWEHFQFAWIERKLGRKLSEADRATLVIQMGWRNEARPGPVGDKSLPRKLQE